MNEMSGLRGVQEHDERWREQDAKLDLIMNAIGKMTDAKLNGPGGKT